MSIFKKIDLDGILAIQKRQFSDKVYLAGLIPASSSLLIKAHITGGHFLSEKITGQYETLTLVNGVIVDDGICHLRGLLKDEGMNRQLYSDYLPLSLILTPGRMKSLRSTTLASDFVGSQVFWPDNFKYLFTDNTDISMDIKNDSTVDIKVEMCFHGTRIWTKG
jgi:hypothetical protein